MLEYTLKQSDFPRAHGKTRALWLRARNRRGDWGSARGRLTEEERARLNDCQNKIQSVANSLAHVDPRKVPDFDEIEECLENADQSLKETLKSNPGPDQPKSGKKGP